jgi:hypothetical protein
VLEDGGGGAVRYVGEICAWSCLRRERGRIRVKAQAYLAAALIDERREPIRERCRANRP